ncbi:putative DNase [Escherichia coli]|nr:putative DNase [Escherichia coli]
MAVLRTLPGRIKTLNTRRVNVLKGEQRRVSGSARVSLKRRIWLRDEPPRESWRLNFLRKR